MKVNGKDDIPYIMENKKCSKPPIRFGQWQCFTNLNSWANSGWFAYAFSIIPGFGHDGRLFTQTTSPNAVSSSHLDGHLASQEEHTLKIF